MSVKIEKNGEKHEYECLKLSTLRCFCALLLDRKSASLVQDSIEASISYIIFKQIELCITAQNKRVKEWTPDLMTYSKFRKKIFRKKKTLPK